MTRDLLQSTTPEQLAQLFLEEVARANLSFAGQRADFLATLRRGTSDDVLDSVVRDAALNAAQLTITEARATFWLQPVTLGWWQKVRIFFGAKKPESWQLGTPQSGVRYEVTIAPSRGGPADLRSQLILGEPQPGSTAEPPRLPSGRPQ